MTTLEKIFIHDSEFPLTDSDNILAGYHAKYSEFDPVYITTHCGKSRQETRDWLESLWVKYQPYAEPNFLINLRRKGEFHAFSWQMYLANVLMDKGYQVKQNTGIGPDIQVIINDKNYWIEAVVTKPGNAKSTGGMIGSGNIYKSLDPRVARISNALMTKYEKYKEKYLDKCCKPNEPYVIAINGTNTDTMLESRALEAVVYGRGNDVFTRNADKKLEGGKYELREKIIVNKDGKDIIVDTNYFCSDEYKEISGVIYCEQHIINANNFGRTPEGNLFFAINGYASNPIENFSIGNMIERLPDGGIKRKK